MLCEAVGQLAGFGLQPSGERHEHFDLAVERGQVSAFEDGGDVLDRGLAGGASFKWGDSLRNVPGDRETGLFGRFEQREVGLAIGRVMGLQEIDAGSTEIGDCLTRGFRCVDDPVVWPVLSTVQCRAGADDSWTKDLAGLNSLAEVLDLVRDRAQLPHAGDTLSDEQWQGVLVAQVGEVCMEVPEAGNQEQASGIHLAGGCRNLDRAFDIDRKNAVAIDQDGGGLAGLRGRRIEQDDVANGE